MSFIIVLNFVKFGVNISLWLMRAVFNVHGAHHNISPWYSNVSVLRNLQQRAARLQ